MVRDLGVGAGAVVLGSFLAMVVYPVGEPAGRVLVLALACGVAVRWLIVRAAVVTAVAAAVVFAHVVQSGYTAQAWPYTPVLGVAAMIGLGYRWLSEAEPV